MSRLRPSGFPRPQQGPHGSARPLSRPPGSREPLGRGWSGHGTPPSEPNHSLDDSHYDRVHGTPTSEPNHNLDRSNPAPGQDRIPVTRRGIVPVQIMVWFRYPPLSAAAPSATAGQIPHRDRTGPISAELLRDSVVDPKPSFNIVLRNPRSSWRSQSHKISYGIPLLMQNPALI